MTVPKHYALLEHKAVPTERRVNATSMQRNSSDLTTLPPGVLLHLIQCLAVYDILCLRRVSTTRSLMPSYFLAESFPFPYFILRLAKDCPNLHTTVPFGMRPS